MKSKFDRSEMLCELLRTAHREREQGAMEGPWQQRTLHRIRHLAAAGRPTAAGLLEAYFWRWFSAGGVAIAVLTVVLLNFEFIPDADLWSFLLYENETLTMLQGFLY